MSEPLSRSEIEIVREALARLQMASRVEPNEEIPLERVFSPQRHRNILDFRRQLVVGNRGSGKSFWAHALTNPEVRKKLAHEYNFPAFARSTAVIGFNGSVKLEESVVTLDDARRAVQNKQEIIDFWRVVILKAAERASGKADSGSLDARMVLVRADTLYYTRELSKIDNLLMDQGAMATILFDALDRLGSDFQESVSATAALVRICVELQSFRNIRAKVFVRQDQIDNKRLFNFPDSSKIKNDRVELQWKPSDLYGLLRFELLRDKGVERILRDRPHDSESLVRLLAGEFMGKDKKRGRVYTWVPLHLSDAHGNCGPRTFLTAWRSAAEHSPASETAVVSPKALIEGVRRASEVRMAELQEDYGEFTQLLEQLQGEFVPMTKARLFDLWKPMIGGQPTAAGEERFLETMISLGVMEVRANGQINVPDIYRVGARIKRKGGVSVRKVVE